MNNLRVVSGVCDMRIAIHLFHQNDSNPCNDSIENSFCSFHSTILCMGGRRKDRDHNDTGYLLFHRKEGNTEKEYD